MQRSPEYDFSWFPRLEATMSTVSMSDAESFYRFLGEQIHLGAVGQTPEELVGAWRRQREYDATLAAVREGLADAEAGRMTPLRKLLDEVRG
jgi:hypothetical protein